LQKSLIEQNLIKTEYLKSYTKDWQQIIDYANNTSWENITQNCGLSYEEITATASLIGKSERVVFAWAMGVTQQANGVDNILSIANTALITGNAGKIGSGTMPIRGHSNVQGFGSMGVTVHLREEIKQALSKLLGKPLSETPGYHTRDLIEAAEKNKVNTLFCLGGNLYAANPDLQQAKQALSQIETIFYISTKPNLGHFHGLGKTQTLILPVFNRFENPHKTTTESGNNFVRLNDEGKSHLQPHNSDLISEIELITEIAHRVHGENPINWRKLQDPVYIRELIAKTIPGYEKIGEIDKTKEEFIIEGRIFEQPKFKTPDGKAQMFVTPLPQLKIPKKSDFGFTENQPGIVLILGTGRSYGQHNTVVYRSEDKYRNMPHRHCIMMNPMDVKKAGFKENQRVKVKGDGGELENIEIICGAIREGVGFMFYPEANVLFKGKVDPKSGTPAYKRVPVFVYAT
jgi:molybdopterin-dependent oxidoreductase alpha subunit